MAEKFAVIRMEKYKTASAIYGISEERKRADGKEFAASDIDHERTKYNVVLHQTDGNWNDAIKEKIAAAGVKKVRDDAVRMIGAVVTASADFFTLNPKYEEPPLDGIDVRTDEEKQKWLYDEKTDRFFRDGYKFFVQTVLKGNEDAVLDARIDMDETTPHLQIYAVPLVKRSRTNKRGDVVEKMHLSAKDIFGNREDLRELQNQFHEMVVQHDKDFQRGLMVDWNLSPEEQKEAKRLHRTHVEYRKEQVRQLDEKHAELALAVSQGQDRVQELKGQEENLIQAIETEAAELANTAQMREIETEHLHAVMETAAEAEKRAKETEERIKELNKQEEAASRNLDELRRLEDAAARRLQTAKEVEAAAKYNTKQLQAEAGRCIDAMQTIQERIAPVGMQQLLADAAWEKVRRDLAAKGWTPDEVQGIVYDEARRRNGYDINRHGWDAR